MKRLIQVTIDGLAVYIIPTAITSFRASAVKTDVTEVNLIDNSTLAVPLRHDIFQDKVLECFE